MLKKYLASSLLLIVFMVNAHAAFSTDMQSLVNQGNSLDSNLSSFSFDQGDDCSQLGTLNTSIETYIESIEMVYAQLSSPLSLTQGDLTSLDDLSNISRSMAQESMRIALELNSIESVADIFEYRAGLSAVLRLSDDIGTMADRILEMANRILIMADNIGSMADKIVFTMTLQSTNMQFIQASLLTTQENIGALTSSLSSVVYNLTLDQIQSDGDTLDSDMQTTILTNLNMADELNQLQAQSAQLMGKVVSLYTFVSINSAMASHYINGDTLTYFSDLSEIHRALAQSTENFARTVQLLAPLTSTPILSDATNSMLELVQDIRIMSDRIMEMSAKIIVMADNIGVMSNRIVEVEGIQASNMAYTVDSLTTAQNITINTIESYGL
ncbi:hypothetical protein MN086_04260 [Sulfurovum sp. XGS-02]|uniref:hypothetical protein n=1 Tax=Sulfurovum sp. XGS-02 TaxID=2925411 RepID=UPI0020476DA5|nr:hypothetical protein [Sulfurovum sp. XGS-02]UPT78363.1 hypothetical protein MN086_04260 [Sulfurovum sp. XGS-02]